jgi:hypothetical protein
MNLRKRGQRPSARQPEQELRASVPAGLEPQRQEPLQEEVQPPSPELEPAQPLPNQRHQ